MPRHSKRKAQLQKIYDSRREDNKRQKLDRNTELASLLRTRRVEDEDNWDEYENFGSESSSDESGLDGGSDEESDLDNVALDKPGEKNVEEGIKVPQDVMSLKWTPGAGAHLRGLRGQGSASTEKRDRQRKRELAVEASQSRSILEMFNIQPQKSLPRLLPPKTQSEI